MASPTSRLERLIPSILEPKPRTLVHASKQCRALLSCPCKAWGEGISSFNDGTTEADVANALYDIIRDGLLGVHPWSFATAHAELVQLPAEPLTDFGYAFELPADFIKALSAGDECRGRGAVYQVIGREVHTNYEEITFAYIKRADEADFPTYFVSALVNRLAAEFCLPLTENSSRSERLFSLADAELKLAKLIDSQQDTPPRVEDFTLIEARL